MADFRIASISSGVALTGVADFSSGSTAVHGTGTSFSSELTAGDVLITGAGNVYAVSSITDDDDLVLQSNATATEAGATMTTVVLTNVETYSTPAQIPVGSIQRWAESFDTGDGLARGLGRLSASWLFPNIDTLTFAGLQAICSSKSIDVYMRTLNDLRLGTYRTYRAGLIWPDDEGQYGNSSTMPFKIEFRNIQLL